MADEYEHNICGETGSFKPESEFGRTQMNVTGLTASSQLWSHGSWTLIPVKRSLWDCLGKAPFSSNVTKPLCQLCKTRSIKTRFDEFDVEELDPTYTLSNTLGLN